VQIKTPWKILIAGLAVGMVVLLAQDKAPPSSYAPVDIRESFASIMARMSAAKPGVVKRQLALLAERYDLANNPAPGVTMSRSKAVQQGVRVKLAESRGTNSPSCLLTRSKPATSFLPASFRCLTRITRKAECFSLSSKIDEINKQEKRDLTRFDLTSIFGPLPSRISTTHVPDYASDPG
jgi:hypothetical protein